ncbi:cryptochrome DASH-like [Diadema antillarum]|uniref:cryptochrome DASH-like n=1 Tax=Diadema antillarum TaxID=105358 RepID=UPI003A8B908B
MAGKMKIIICLLRNDLRYHDNEVLFWAHKNAVNVLPLYCFDPRHYKGTWHFDFAKTGPHRLKFLLESIVDLRSTLKSIGSGLVVRNGPPEDVVPELIHQLGQDQVGAVALQEEVTREELDVEAGLQQSCSKLGVHFKKFWGSTLYHREDVPFSPQGVPNMYTEFRKRVENQARVRPAIQMPRPLKGLPEGIEEGEIPTFAMLGMKEPTTDSRTAFPFAGGESTGLARINDYFWKTDCIAKYKETRNGLIGADYSTKFAAWLAHGCLSPRQIYKEVKKYEKERTANQSTYWVIFELIWRDYFKFVALKFGDRLFYLSGLLGTQKQWNKNQRWFEAWCQGRTGVPFVDANMREVAATGFMSNRGRQNVASFLTKDLGLDWRLGAEWFEYLLVDHDVTSNYGNWLYSAGVGNDPRQDRKFNMIKQGLDYDPEGDYIRQWVPELNRLKGSGIHMPWTLSGTQLSQAGVSIGETYPAPIVKAPEWGRHTSRMGSSGGSRGGGGGGGGGRNQSGKGQRRNHGSRGQQRGIDFYFSNPSKKSEYY